MLGNLASRKRSDKGSEDPRLNGWISNNGHTGEGQFGEVSGRGSRSPLGRWWIGI